MSGIFFQVQAFVLTMLDGILFEMVLHFYQLVVKNGRIGRYTLCFLDVLFWIVMILLVFLSLLFINQGEMRSYVLISLIIGAGIYYQCLSKKLEPGLAWVAEGSVRLHNILIKNNLRRLMDLARRIKQMKIIRTRPDDEDPQEK